MGVWKQNKEGSAYNLYMFCKFQIAPFIYVSLLQHTRNMILKKDMFKAAEFEPRIFPL